MNYSVPFKLFGKMGSSLSGTVFVLDELSL